MNSEEEFYDAVTGEWAQCKKKKKSYKLHCVVRGYEYIAVMKEIKSKLLLVKLVVLSSEKKKGRIVIQVQIWK